MTRQQEYTVKCPGCKQEFRASVLKRHILARCPEYLDWYYAGYLGELQRQDQQDLRAAQDRRYR